MTRSPANRDPRQGLWPALRLPFVLALCALGLWGQALWTSAALAADTDSDPQVLPSTQEVEDALPEGGTLSGREIYERFLDNKYRRSVQRMRVVSRDPGGNEQTTTFKVSLEDFRNEQEEPTWGSTE